MSSLADTLTVIVPAAPLELTQASPFSWLMPEIPLEPFAPLQA
jgi:hypothetical protein